MCVYRWQQVKEATDDLWVQGTPLVASFPSPPFKSGASAFLMDGSSLEIAKDLLLMPASFGSYKIDGKNISSYTILIKELMISKEVESTFCKVVRVLG